MLLQPYHHDYVKPKEKQTATDRRRRRRRSDKSWTQTTLDGKEIRYFLYGVPGVTTGKFCDVHDKGGVERLIVPEKGKHVYGLKIEYEVFEKDRKNPGKQIRWILESGNLNMCHKDATELILKRASALGVDLGWKKYRLIKDAAGKFSRLYADEEIPDELESQTA